MRKRERELNWENVSSADAFGMFVHIAAFK